MKKLLLLLSLSLAWCLPAHAQSTAAQVTPGFLTTSGCPGGQFSCFLPYSAANPLPVIASAASFLCPSCTGGELLIGNSSGGFSINKLTQGSGITVTNGNGVITIASTGGGGTGTVTAVSVATANGFSGTVTNPTTTPAIMIIAGAITPTSVNGLTITTSTGTLTIANLKVLTTSNTLTFTGTDGSSVNFGAGGTVLYGNQTITLSGDTTGSGTTTITTTTVKVNGVSYGTSPATNTVPVVTGTNAITYETVPNAALTNPSTTVSGQICTLGSSCTIPVTGLASIAADTIIGNPTGSLAAPIATTAPTVTGIMTASGFTSMVTTGTAPLIVASTTNVANLNASTLTGDAVGTTGATIPLNNGNITHSGTMLFTGTVPTLANGNASVAASATLGGLFTGQGSTNDITLQNKSAGSVCTVATGTTTLNCTGLQVGGVAVGTGNGTVTNVSVVTANGTSGSVATSTTIPAITLSYTTQTAGNNSANVATTAYVDRGASGASTVLIGTATASSSVSITFSAIPTGYDQYQLRYNAVIPSTAAGNLLVRIGGLSTGYEWSTWSTVSNNTSGSGANTNDQGFNIANGGIGTTSGIGASGDIVFSGLTSSNQTQTNWRCKYFDGSSDFNNNGGGRQSTAGPFTSITVLMSNGNIASGTFALYGIRNQ